MITIKMEEFKYLISTLIHERDTPPGAWCLDCSGCGSVCSESVRFRFRGEN